MANRNLHKFRGSLERDLVDLYGSAVIGSSGAVGTVKGLGIASVKKETADGQYTITLDDHWYRYMFGSANFVSAAGSGIAKVEVLANPATFQSGFQTSKAITIQCFDYAGAAANPAAGSVLSFVATVRNTSVSKGD